MTVRIEPGRPTPERLAAIGACLVLAAGATACRVGPIFVTIDTGSERVDDFVVEPAFRYGGLHSGEFRRLPARVAASGEKVIVPPAPRGGWNFDGVFVSVYHPAYEYVWTGVTESLGGPIELPVVRPRAWADVLQAEPGVSLTKVDAHLDRLESDYYPVALRSIEPVRLRRDLPVLRALVDAARYQVGDDGHGWTSEEQARAEFRERLAAISEKLR